MSVINPAQVKAYGAALSTHSKTDAADARLIANFCIQRNSMLGKRRRWWCARRGARGSPWHADSNPYTRAHAPAGHPSKNQRQCPERTAHAARANPRKTSVNTSRPLHLACPRSAAGQRTGAGGYDDPSATELPWRIQPLCNDQVGRGLRETGCTLL